MTEAICKMCGKCCHYEIPVTLLDIHRLARYRNVADEKAFREYIQPVASPRSSLFMISKRQTGACIFLDGDNRCSVHAVKPKGCTFYLCSRNKGGNGKNDIVPWTATCTDAAMRADLWEQSVASILTKAYIENNGAVWNDADYYKAILSIYDNVVISDRQKIKLARSEDGAPVSMIYSCAECEKRGTWSRETPVTLDDISRITARLGTSWGDFFRQYIDTQGSTGTGGLKLKRNGRCVFFDEKEHCTINEVRPMHCRFTPCPRRAMSDEMMDCFFLGSGTVEEQFRHQVALAMTRQYFDECGAQYRGNTARKLLKEIEQLTRSRKRFEDFCRQVARYRYVDDTLMTLKQQEKKETG
jgi:Fe-S-cluster containining protein